MRDIVYETLRNAIVSGRLLPGDRLVETQIAEQLRVSRTPVREALRMLVKDGFAVDVPRNGTVIAGMSKDDASEIYDLRAVIEGLSARRAAANITPQEIKQLRNRLERMRPQTRDYEKYMKAHAEFNAIIVGASRGHRISQFVQTLSDQTRRLRSISLTTIERREEAWKEHCAIVDALCDRNADRAELLARQHVEHAKAAFLAQWQ
ncbi:MAG: GntR family transcriptional regulator [Bacillota bacterium]